MTPEWEAGLRRSRIFMCIVTEDYLRKPECWEQMTVAKQLGKPCIALVHEDADVPEGFLDGFDDLRVYSFTTTADLDRIASVLRPESGDGMSSTVGYDRNRVHRASGLDRAWQCVLWPLWAGSRTTPQRWALLYGRRDWLALTILSAHTSVAWPRRGMYAGRRRRCLSHRSGARVASPACGLHSPRPTAARSKPGSARRRSSSGWRIGAASFCSWRRAGRLAALPGRSP